MIKDYIDSFSEIIHNTSITDAVGNLTSDRDAYKQAAESLTEIRARHGTVYLIGNGGSSGIISHAAIDLLNKGHFKAYPVTDNSLLTCLSNDYGYENLFLKVLEKSATSHDALIAMSSSGQSANVVNAARWAKEQGLFDGNNALRSCGHVNFWLNAKEYGRVEIGHALLLHIMTDALWIK
jgi:D-sedoheptulose 7-phosphate isomerase